ncbi:MAG: hypothetical protein WC848_03175 [Parcubacteria group bacterium]|jgi:hypothetical protein
MNLSITKVIEGLTGKNSASTREIVKAEVADVSKMNPGNFLETIHVHRFLKHIFDFLDSSPDTFKVSSVLGGRRGLTEEDWRRPAENIPSYKEGLEKLFSQATDRLAYILLPVRWPRHYKEFRAEGFTCSSDLAIAILPEDHHWHRKHTVHDMVSIATHFIRGAFNYGEFGVFILAIPIVELGDYFKFFNDWHLRSKDSVHIPPKYIVDLIGSPSDRDKALLEVVMRSYWYKLKKFGFRAMTKYNQVITDQDLLHGEIPRVLKKGDIEVGLGDEWRAQGTLEVIHRIYIINEIIEAHKANSQPQLDMPPLLLETFTGRLRAQT